MCIASLGSQVPKYGYVLAGRYRCSDEPLPCLARPSCLVLGWRLSPATGEAAFLHGRYVWSCWDVNELATGEIRGRLDSDPDYLRLGMIGMKLANHA